MKRRAVGCALLVAVSVTVLLEVAGPTVRRLSPVNLVSPIRSEDDPQLRGALQRALCGQPTGPLPFSSRYPQHDVLETRIDDVADFEARLRSVPGWDLIAIIPAYDTGARAAADPRIRSWGLRRHIAGEHGFTDDFHFTLVVVRGDAIVARFVVWMIPVKGEWQDVVVREP
jgi:hypothetical protein